MKQRSIFSGLAAIVLVLSIGAGGFYWLSSQNTLKLVKEGGRVATPTTAVFVPKQAPVMVSLLVNPSQLERLQQLQTSWGKRPPGQAYLDQIKSSLVAPSGLDYEKYIAPWVGDEVTLAITTQDIDRDSSNGREQGVLLVASIKDGERARKMLELFWQRQAMEGQDLVFESSNDIEIISSRQQKSMATAVVGANFVLFANDPKVLRDAINNVQVSERNITSVKKFQQALADFDYPKIGLIYVNLASQGVMGDLAKEAKPGLYKSVAIAVRLNEQGLLSSTSWFAADRGSQTDPGNGPALSKPVGALQYIPGESVVVAGSKDLAHLWEELQGGISGYESLENLLSQSIADLQTRWGIDLPADVFSQVRGEYAVGLLPRQDSSEIDGIFVVEKSSKRTPQLIGRWDEIAQQQGYSISEVGDRPIYVWTKLPESFEVPASVAQEGSEVPASVAQEGSEVPASVAQEELTVPVKGARTRAGKYEIFATSLEAIEAAIKAPKEGSVVQAKNFIDSIAPLAKSNDGYFYLDWVHSKKIWESKVPLLRLVEAIGKPLFENLETLTISSYGSEADKREADIFFRLGK